MTARRPSDAALGLQPGELRFLKKALDNRCEICGRVSRLCVDHLQNSEVFRGLLCNGCNRAVGLLQDDPIVLASAALYLSERGNAAQRHDPMLENALAEALERAHLSLPDFAEGVGRVLSEGGLKPSELLKMQRQAALEALRNLGLG
jgi:hypothetical protein